MSHIPSHPDQDLLGKKGGQGFPHLVFMDDEGTVVSEVNSRDLAGFKAAQKIGSDFVSTKKAYEAKPDDSALRDAYFSVALKGNPSPAFLEKAMKLANEGKLPEALVKEVKGSYALVKINEISNSAQSHFKNRPSQEEFIGFLGPKFYKLYQDGFVPAPKLSRQAIDFWYCLIQVAKKEKDVKAMEAAYENMQLIFKGDTRPQVLQLIEGIKKDLDALKGS